MKSIFKRISSRHVSFDHVQQTNTVSVKDLVDHYTRTGEMLHQPIVEQSFDMPDGEGEFDSFDGQTHMDKVDFYLTSKSDSQAKEIEVSKREVNSSESDT